MTYSARIAELYGERFLRKSALSIRDGAGVFEAILGPGRFKTILEIGTYRGVSAAELSRYGKVITIDLKNGKFEQQGETVGRQALWKALGIENIDFRRVRNNWEKAQLIAGLDFDFAFVDGAHDQTVRDDFEMVKKCGHVLFHDYDSRGQPDKDYVFDFINTLPKEQVTVMDIFAYWHG